MTLYDLLAQAAARNPDAPALRFHEQTITYRALLAGVDGLAGGLAALPIGRRACVALLLPNCPAFVTAYFAAGRAGATLVPLNVLYRPDEARYILADCEAEVLITSAMFRPLVHALQPHLPHLKHVVMVGDDPVEPGEVDFATLCGGAPVKSSPITERDVAVLLYTSGTTGRPKGAMLTHRNLIANAQSCADVLPVTAQDTFLSALPLFHAFAAMVFLVLPVLVGARSQIMERFLPGHTLRLLEESAATFFGGVPSMFGLMLQASREAPPDLHALRLCVSGGAPLPPEVWTAFEHAFDVKLVEGYGLTEASPVVTVNPPCGLRKVGSIGQVIPGVDYKIVDARGCAVAVGGIGELAIRGDNVMKGYLHRAEETREAIRSGWLFTGDLARADEDGYLYIVGRKKELIIVGGLNVYPGEVERVLVEHPAVLEAAAFGVPDAARGEAVWAAVVPRPDEIVTVKELQALCREKLAAYKVPRGIELRDTLPKNALGKVQRHVLHQEVVEQQEEAEKVGVTA